MRQSTLSETDRNGQIRRHVRYKHAKSGNLVDSVFPCVVVFFLILLSACGGSQQGKRTLYQIDLNKSKPERLLRFYFGGLASNEGVDPFSTGLIVKQEQAYMLDASKLSAKARIYIQDVDGDGVLIWDELEPFLQKSYYAARKMPSTLDELKQAAGFSKEAWFSVGVDGVMTTARREVYVSRLAIQAAILGYRENSGNLIYPQGTVFIGEHLVEDRVAETTVMQKRDDAFWDFAVYDQAGNIVPETNTPPRNLAVPTRCVGCHFGEKKFEPENSFPFPSTPGPNGPRAIHVQTSPQDTIWVKYLDEHVKRSDTVLGLYATIYLSQLKEALEAGKTLEEADLKLLTLFEQGR